EPPDKPWASTKSLSVPHSTSYLVTEDESNRIEESLPNIGTVKIGDMLLKCNEVLTKGSENVLYSLESHDVNIDKENIEVRVCIRKMNIITLDIQLVLT